MQNTQKQNHLTLSQNLKQKKHTRNANQISNESPNLSMLKKMFTRGKSKSEYVPNEQSLLFNRHNSLAMFKAYQKRKKIFAKEPVINKELQNFFQQDFDDRTIDSPQKPNFALESVKIDFDKNDISKKLYKQLLKKIEQQNLLEAMRLPDINIKTYKKQSLNQPKQPQYPKLQKITQIDQNKINFPTLSNQRQNQEKKLLQSIQIKKLSSKTIDPCIKQGDEKYQIYHGRRLKNNQQSRIIIVKASLRKSLQNPETNEKKKVSSVYGTSSQVKFSNQIQVNQNNNIQPSLKLVKSVKSLASQKSNRPKGYMYFHMEAKQFLKQNKQKMNQEPKIKQFLITGISAINYAVIDIETMALIACKNFQKKIQIASISKVMTCYLCLLACKKYNIDYKQYRIRVNQSSVEMPGTSAELQIGDSLTLQQLMYGLMLPSGNDASVAIAETIGKIIQKHKKKQTKKTYYQTFIAHMNILSRQLKLDQQWKNSSGLPQNPNHSTPHSISLLTIVAMMDNKFRQIVSCKQYLIEVKNQRFGLKRKVIWKNTNKLLDDGWQGVKTGMTEQAGHCLIAKKERYLISVYNSKTNSKRFSQCSQLYDFVKSKEIHLFPQKLD